MADVTPMQIVMANRTRTPTHDELAGQVTTLARALAAVGQQADGTQVVAQSNLQALNGRLPTPGLAGPSRAFDTPFQISTTAPALVVYTLALTVNAALLVVQNIQVNLLVDQQGPPAQMVGSVYQGVTGLTITSYKQLVGWVPAGYWVSLQTIANGGTANIISQSEIIFGA